MSASILQNLKTRKMTLGSILIAVIILMSFTPLGYLRIPALAIEITFIVIPVAVGALLLGKYWGALLGGIFGITSFIQCFTGSVFGAALIAENAVFTFILCMIPRILMGFLVGLFIEIYSKAAKSEGTKTVGYILGSVIAPLLNTVFFLLFLIVFFRNSDLSSIGLPFADMKLWDILVVLVSINSAIEIVSCGIIGFALSKVILRFVPAYRNTIKNPDTV